MDIIGEFMQVPLIDLKTQIYDFLSLSGANHQDATTLTDLVVEQEMVGNQFSAVAGLTKKHADFTVTADQIEVVSEKISMQLIKGNGRFASLITADHLDKIIEKAKTQGIYTFGIYDSTYNDFFDIFCRRVAAKDCIALIFENGGPQGVVPYGGKKDVTGTNPIAFGIPTHEYPVIFDAATAMYAYSRIFQAREIGKQLPENAYVDQEGNLTTDPQKAYAILPFGGYKGFAINLLIDVLSGALVRGRSGLDQPVDSQRYIGTLIIVIDPAAFGDLTEFKDATTKLTKDILAVPAVDSNKPVRVPGFRGSQRKTEITASGVIEIEDRSWQKFIDAYTQLKNSKAS